MDLAESEDFGARDFDDSGKRKIHDHLFAAANSAIPYLLGMPPEVDQARDEFLDGVMRVDIFGLKEGGAIDAPLRAPIRPQVPVLQPGQRYLLETVIRTVKMGHLFTQGTADSNEVWMDVTVSSGGRIIGRSGGMKDGGEVDPWSHFVNAYVLDRDGNRIDRRNAQDIFVPLYNHQIPPGAGDVVHYVMDIPRDVHAPVTVEAKLQYRKFDTTYMKHFQDEKFVTNDLPVVTLASDRVTFPVAGTAAEAQNPDSKVAPWERWNDYGIGLLRKGSKGSSKGELRQAEQAFTAVEQLGRPDGPLNLARVYLKEGRLLDASAALHRAAQASPPAPPWSVTWFTGLVNKQSGYLDAAIADFKQLVQTNFAEARKREFDFSQDYRLLNQLGQTVFERAKQERGDARKTARQALLREAVGWFKRALVIDPENATAHYNLGLIYAQLGDEKSAQTHRVLHAKYKPDDNARERAVTLHRRRNPAANHAAEAVVLYDLRRPGAYGLPAPGTVAASDTNTVQAR
jgi:tetratricopeptide (TPR) repeat protein